MRNLHQLLDRGGYPSLARQLSKQVFQKAIVDSRQAGPGDLFFALKGMKSDGHQYLSEVAFRGVKAAVVSNDYSGHDFGLELLKVSEPLDCLQDLARAQVKDVNAPVVAITGSMGKTTTKKFVKDLLSSGYVTMAPSGNQNSQVGLPLALLNEMPENPDFLILEMGMTHKGQIRQLTQIAPPKLALITTVAPVHIANFDNVESIAIAKSEIFEHSSTLLGFLPIGMINFEYALHTGKCNKATFSLVDHQADYTLSVHPDSIIFKGKDVFMTLPPLNVPGRHNLQNFLAALCLVHQLGIDHQTIQEAIPKLTLEERRLEIVICQGITFINDSYNACEDSVKGALEYLSQMNLSGKRVAVLGSLLELGSYSEEIHERIGNYALDKTDILICYGEECCPMFEVWNAHKRPTYAFDHLEHLLEHLKGTLQKGDVVLLKGANSKQLWKILDSYR